MIITKICTKCQEEKSLDSFSKRNCYKDGYISWCKECVILSSLEWREKNKEKHSQTSKKYKKENKAKIKKQSAEYNKKNKDRFHKKRMLRLKTDKNFKLLYNLRTRFSNALQGKTKTKRTLELIGCTIEELKQHLESQFKSGMTWDNHTFNGWHIDHIKPCILFDLTDPKQQKECFNYTNLQPLWAIENWSKGSKIIN